MNPSAPPPLPKPPHASLNRRVKLLIALALVPAICFGAFVVLRVCGLIRPFLVPTGAMAPAIQPGDHILMQNFSYLSRQPRRGDIAVFKPDGIALLSTGAFYVKRIAGEQGDHLRISEGKLFINGNHVSLSNSCGEIAYDSPPASVRVSMQTDVTVPSGCYFVLGDNSTNSLDSRFFGSVPRENIIGRVSFCYWPPGRIAKVK